MDAVTVIDIMRDGIFVLIKISAPVMLVSLLVGLAISLFQALTQIQEMTLTFVPKILCIFVCLILFMPYMINTLVDFSNRLSDRIVQVEEQP